MRLIEFRADAERDIDAAMRHRVRRLHQHLDAGAAHALHEMRRHLDRHARIEPDMARQHVRIETRLRHVAGDDRADLRRIDLRSLQHRARRLDAEIDRRDLRERAVVIGERRAHAVEQPGVVPGGAET